MGVACECGLVGPSGSMNSPFHREKGCHITRISWCHVGKVKEYGAKKKGAHRALGWENLKPQMVDRSVS